MIIANVLSTYTTVLGLWQYDYRQFLRIQGLDLPNAVEIDFSLDEKAGNAIPRVGLKNKSGDTDVEIPSELLENSCTTEDYKIFAFVYLSDQEGGKTKYVIVMPVKSRPQTDIDGCGCGNSGSKNLFSEVINQINVSATAALQSKEEAADYAQKAEDAIKNAEQQIDDYIEEKKEDLKGEPGNTYFAAFRIENGRLKMLQNPKMDKIKFVRKGSRLGYMLYGVRKEKKCQQYRIITIEKPI